MKWFLICTGVCFVSFAYGQNTKSEKDKKNAIYLEVGGNSASFMSLNYERIVYQNQKKTILLPVRIGFSFQKSDYDSTQTYAMPIEFNSLFLLWKNEHDKHYAEFGIGYTPFISTGSITSDNIPDWKKGKSFNICTIRIGYRFFFEKVAIIRVGYLGFIHPIVPGSSELGYTGFGGFSFGLMF